MGGGGPCTPHNIHSISKNHTTEIQLKGFIGWLRIAFRKHKVEPCQDFNKIQINFKLISLSLFKMISIMNIFCTVKKQRSKLLKLLTVFTSLAALFFTVYTVWTLLKLLTQFTMFTQFTLLYCFSLFTLFSPFTLLGMPLFTNIAVLNIVQ